MAKTSADILKEYLIAIGFKVDEPQFKGAKSNLAELAKKFENLALQASAAATTLAASVTEIASRLEKLYFASQRTGASVQNIQALRYGAEQIGVSADEAQAALEGMTRAMRLNPGLVGMLKSLNINPDQDKVKVLMDLVDHLRRMPFYQGAAVGRLFGLDDNTLLMLEKNFDKLKQYEEERQRIAAQGGMDADKMALKSHEFMQHLRGLEERLGVLWDLIAARLLPAGEMVITWLDKTVDYFIRADKATDGWSSRLVGLASALGGVAVAAKGLSVIGGALGLSGKVAGGGGILGLVGKLAKGPLAPGLLGGFLAKYGIEIKTDEINTRADAEMQENIASSKQAQAFVSQYEKETGRKASDDYFAYNAWLRSTGRRGKANTQPIESKPIASADVHQLIRKYATKFGVDIGLAEGVAYAESRFKQSAVSKKGALGVFQLMPKTAAGLGVDPHSLEGNVEGGLHYLSGLLAKYAGNEALALAEYNAGPVAMKQYGGIPPFKETRNYIDEIMQYRLTHDGTGKNGMALSQKTEINVNGTDNPNRVAQDVLQGQDRVNGDLVRNFVGATR